MTYVASIQQITEIQSSVINCQTPSSVAVNGVFSLSGTPTPNSSISSNSLVLSAGHHFYLEASVLVQNSGTNGALEWSFHDGSSFIGQEGFMNFATSFGGVSRVSRRVARALITDTGSDQTVDCRIKSLSGSGWNMTVTATGISTFNYVGYPSLRIWEVKA